MRVCIECAEEIKAPSWRCRACLWEPGYAGGIPVFRLKDGRLEQSGFASWYFEELHKLERRYFWFSARAELIALMARRIFPSTRSILEVGCGTGMVLERLLGVFPKAASYGMDNSLEALNLARDRLKETVFFMSDARMPLPFVKEFDFIGLFDVLEHFKEDCKVLCNINKALSTGGGLLITVPQHPSLWSIQDAFSFHFRRYSLKDLQEKLKSCGFRVDFHTSFMTFLLPAMMISRLFVRYRCWRPLSRGAKRDPFAELRIDDRWNEFLARIMSLEIKLIAKGVKFGMGGSLLVACVKTHEAPAEV